MCADHRPEYNSKAWVSKLTTAAVAARELAATAPLRILDPEAQFTAIPVHVCKLAAADAQINTNFSARNLTGARDTLVIMPNGGISLSIVFTALEKAAYIKHIPVEEIPPLEYINDIIRALKALGEFVIIMNEAGVYHNDIQFDNILYNQDTKQARIIDFELGGGGIKHKDMYDLMHGVIEQMYDFQKRIYPESIIPDLIVSTIKWSDASSYTKEQFHRDLAKVQENSGK